mmetsp:Transcript_30672/g.25880  ORF Transcript_30672/g.25880 Transcript_30672/m.25880 type:complete len:84 (-) Transcript_30672:34-285(-)
MYLGNQVNNVNQNQGSQNEQNGEVNNEQGMEDLDMNIDGNNNVQQNLNEQNAVCTICLNTLENNMILHTSTCNHKFHQLCITN